MNRGPMQLLDTDRTTKVADGLDANLEELIRRARLQASELSLMIQRLERLRRDIRHHLSHDHLGASIAP